ncbi:MAG: trypsin-like serine peptidase [Kiloniellaceae bacterium]
MSDFRNAAFPPSVQLAVAAGLLVLLQACAQPQQQPGAQPPASLAPDTAPQAASLGGRMIADAREYPWSALGRVNLAGTGFCTGVVIGPQHVLTQARCLYAAREGRWWQPQELHFIAAYQRDSYLADSKIADFSVAPGFNPRAGTSLSNITNNWALVTLQQPLGNATGWLGLEWDSARLQQAARGVGTAYLRAGYRADWPHAVSLHFGCDESEAGLVRLCEATPSELALPTFVATDGELRVLADFYISTPAEGDNLARLTGNAIGGARLGRTQAPAGQSQVRGQPTATATDLLASLGYEVSGGRLGAAAAAFRRDRDLPPGEGIDLALLAALVSAAQAGGR